MSMPRPRPWSSLTVALMLGSVALSGCSLLPQPPQRVMGVEISRTPAAYHSTQLFATRAAVLAKMQPGCYFCSPQAMYLNQCTLIQSTTRAQAKLMHLADLKAHLPGGTLPTAWQGASSGDQLVWVAAVSGVVSFTNSGANAGAWKGDRQWAVFVLPYRQGLLPQVADAGPPIAFVNDPSWPAYYDALPDLAAA